MNKKQNKDKQLLENLDRIVAGEKLKDDSGLDKDTKAALELSREMTSWPKSPSKEFKADLKARVTHRLAEEKKRETIFGSKTFPFPRFLVYLFPGFAGFFFTA